MTGGRQGYLNETKKAVSEPDIELVVKYSPSIDWGFLPKHQQRNKKEMKRRRKKRRKGGEKRRRWCGGGRKGERQRGEGRGEKRREKWEGGERACTKRTALPFRLLD